MINVQLVSSYERGFDRRKRETSKSNMSMTYTENARGFADHNRRDYAALTSTYFDGDDYAPLTSMCFDRAALTSTYFDGDDYAPLTSRGFDRDASMIMELRS